MSITIVLYSHDSVGLGHARRNRALAHALAADLPRLTGQSVRGLLIAGHPDATADALPQGWDWLVLPGFTRTADGYTSRRLDVSNDRLFSLRSATAAAAVDAMSPDLFIADRHPFGVGGELQVALEGLRARGARCVLGMRDVLDSPPAAAAEWRALGGAAAAAAFYQAVWVYGDPLVYSPVASGEIPAPLAARTHFTGYLSRGRPTDDLTDSSLRPARPYVLTMVGGGSDGGALALAAAQARVPAGHRHVILTGPQMPPEDHDQVLRAVAGSVDQHRIQLTRSAPHVPQLVREAAAVVSMAGYNSTAEIMATTTPALLIPRSRRRAEQPRRAAALTAVGAVEVLESENLSPQRIGRFFSRAVTHRTVRDRVDLDGLGRIGLLAAAELSKAPAVMARASVPAVHDSLAYASASPAPTGDPVPAIEARFETHVS